MENFVPNFTIAEEIHIVNKVKGEVIAQGKIESAREEGWRGASVSLIGGGSYEVATYGNDNVALSSKKLTKGLTARTIKDFSDVLDKSISYCARSLTKDESSKIMDLMRELEAVVEPAIKRAEESKQAGGFSFKAFQVAWGNNETTLDAIETKHLKRIASQSFDDSADKLRNSPVTEKA